MALYQAGETVNTGKCKPCITTQDENQKKKECVFAWTVLLRNVTLVHESQKGIMDELQQRKRGQVCVPAPTWMKSNSNISVNKPLSTRDQCSTATPGQRLRTEGLNVLFYFQTSLYYYDM